MKARYCISYISTDERRRRNEKNIVMIISVILCFGLAACGGSSDNPEKTGNDIIETIDLTGTWKQVNGNSEDTWQEATKCN